MTDRPTFGPWRPGIDAAERRARCRSMRAVAGLLIGPRADALCEALIAAETDPDALDQAAVELDRLASLDRRHILASYGTRAKPPALYVNPQRVGPVRVTLVPRGRVRPLGRPSARAMSAA